MAPRSGEQYNWAGGSLRTCPAKYSQQPVPFCIVTLVKIPNAHIARELPASVHASRAIGGSLKPAPMTSSLVEFYRCPENLVDIEVARDLSIGQRRFYFGEQVSCYGRFSLGAAVDPGSVSLRSL